MFAIINKFIKKYNIKILKKRLNKIGSNVILNYPIKISLPENVNLENNIYIGPDAWISSYTQVTIKNGTIIGPRIKIYTGNHNYNSEISIPYDHITYVKRVTIEENVWIGGDVIILPGVTIGEGAVIGAGSVVTKSVPAGSVMGGNPAKKIKERDMDIYYKLKKESKIYLKLKKEKYFSSQIQEL